MRKQLTIRNLLIFIPAVLLVFSSNLSAQQENYIEEELQGPSMRDILDEPQQPEEESLPREDYIEKELQGPAMRAILQEEPTVDFCAEEGADTGLGAMINEYVEFGGAIEVESFWIKDFDGHHESDISLEAAEIDFEITVTDWAIGVLAIEWEPDEERIEVKEAFVTFGDTECIPYLVIMGRIFVPFGIGTGAVVGDTLSVSDPLTIEIFETREDVILFGYRKNGWYGGVYFFNGDTNSGHGEDDHIEQYGASIRYGVDEPDYSYSVGIDYISSVFDSDNLSEVFPGALEGARYAPGIALHVRYFNHGFHFIAEYNGAFRSSAFDVIEFEDEEEIIEEVSLQPYAWQIEVGYVTEICCHTTYFALNYSESCDLDGFFPRRRFLANVGRWIYEDSILLALEYGRDWDYSKSRGGTGKEADFVIFQMAYEW